MIAISPLTSEHLVAYLRRREEGPVGGAVARAKGCCLELLVIRVNIFDDAAEVVSAERWDTKRTGNGVRTRRILPGREGQRDTPVVKTAFDLVVNGIDSSNVHLHEETAGYGRGFGQFVDGEGGGGVVVPECRVPTAWVRQSVRTYCETAPCCPAAVAELAQSSAPIRGGIGGNVTGQL